jgi:hypothetical protein
MFQFFILFICVIILALIITKFEETTQKKIIFYTNREYNKLSKHNKMHCRSIKCGNCYKKITYKGYSWYYTPDPYGLNFLCRYPECYLPVDEY